MSSQLFVEGLQLEAIRARLDEPPPVINNGITPIVEYLNLLRHDRIQLVDELDRLRAEMTKPDGTRDSWCATNARKELDM